jgi:hypothetical protein
VLAVIGKRHTANRSAPTGARIEFFIPNFKEEETGACSEEKITLKTKKCGDEPI